MDSGNECRPRTGGPSFRAVAPKDASGSRSAPATATETTDWSRRRRLLRRGEFRSAYEKGMRRTSAHFTVFGLRRDATLPSRFGITVPRPVGNAPDRNRLRRRTREILRRQGSRIGNGWDVVINPRGSALRARFALLETELAALLERLRQC